MKHLPGILFLLAMPCSVFLFIKVSDKTGSDILALVSAVALSVIVGLLVAFVMNRKSSDKE